MTHAFETGPISNDLLGVSFYEPGYEDFGIVPGAEEVNLGGEVVQILNVNDSFKLGGLKKALAALNNPRATISEAA